MKTVIIYIVCLLLITNTGFRQVNEHEQQKGYWIYYKCCFINDSAIIHHNYSRVDVLLQTNPSTDVDNNNIYFYQSGNSPDSVIVTLTRNQKKLIIKLPPTDKTKYVEVYNMQNFYYNILDKQKPM